MMHLVTYNDYVCYDTRSYFSRQPGEMTCCPMCKGPLTQSDIHPSWVVSNWCFDPEIENALLTWHDFSHVLTCPTCRWWYIRESWFLGEVYSDNDCIATGAVKKWALSEKKPLVVALREALAPHTILDAETVRNVIAERSRAVRQPYEAHLVGTSQSAGDARSDVYLLEGYGVWLLLVKQTPEENAIVVDAIDILNGVMIEDGQPVGMIVTTTDLPAEGDSKAPLDHIKKYRKTYCVPFVNKSAGRKLLERLSAAAQPAPWQKALDDSQLYEHALTLPKVYGTLFSNGEALSDQAREGTPSGPAETKDIPKENPFSGNFEDQLPRKKLPKNETVEKDLLGLKDIDPEKRIRAMRKLSDVVYGNQEDLNRIVIRAVPEIISLLGDPSWKVRSWAVRLLGRIGYPAEAAIPHLVNALGDQITTVRECAAYALGLLGPKAGSAIPVLEKALHDLNREVRTHAHMSLRKLQHKTEVSEKLYDDDEFVCYKIDDDALDIHYYEAGYRRRAPAANKPHPEIKMAQQSHKSKRPLSEKETAEWYLRGLKDTGLQKRLDAMLGLDKIIRAGQVDLDFTITKIAPKIKSVLRHDESWKVRGWAVWLLGQIDAPGVISPLITALGDQQAVVREFAARALGGHGAKAEAAIPMLEKALYDADRGVRTAAHGSLRKIQQKNDLSEKMSADDELVCRRIDDDTLDIHYYEVGYRRPLPQDTARSKIEGIRQSNGSGSQSLRFRPGDTVRLTQDDWRVPGPDLVSLLAATKGSIGTVISYEEYCETVRRRYPGQEWVEFGFLQLKEQMEKGDHIIRFEWVEPLSTWELVIFDPSPTFIDFKVGDMDHFPVGQLEKITLLP